MIRRIRHSEFTPTLFQVGQSAQGEILYAHLRTQGAKGVLLEEQGTQGHNSGYGREVNSLPPGSVLTLFCDPGVSCVAYGSWTTPWALAWRAGTYSGSSYELNLGDRGSCGEWVAAHMSFSVPG